MQENDHKCPFQLWRFSITYYKRNPGSLSHNAQTRPARECEPGPQAERPPLVREAQKGWQRPGRSVQGSVSSSYVGPARASVEAAGGEVRPEAGEETVASARETWNGAPDMYLTLREAQGDFRAERCLPQRPGLRQRSEGGAKSEVKGVQSGRERKPRDGAWPGEQGRALSPGTGTGAGRCAV